MHILASTDLEPTLVAVQRAVGIPLEPAAQLGRPPIPPYASPKQLTPKYIHYHTELGLSQQRAPPTEMFVHDHVITIATIIMNILCTPIILYISGYAWHGMSVASHVTFQ